MPTNTTPAADQRHSEITAFYTAHAAQLRANVSRHATANDATIDDACQTAWTRLLNRPDITLDRRGLNWLTTVAIHEAWQLAAPGREVPAGGFQGITRGHDTEMPEPPAHDPRSAEDQALDRIADHERLRVLATLKPRERDALILHARGYTYKQIADLLELTYTAVNRAITEGHAALRAGGRTPTRDAGAIIL